jgi:hypothetical protein
LCFLLVFIHFFAIPPSAFRDFHIFQKFHFSIKGFICFVKFSHFLSNSFICGAIASIFLSKAFIFVQMRRPSPFSGEPFGALGAVGKCFGAFTLGSAESEVE